ncbi:MAG TPA: hypothetical protein VEI97_01515 [bacterium]|nr:hypothetical protein [bacterium]
MATDYSHIHGAPREWTDNPGGPSRVGPPRPEEVARLLNDWRRQSAEKAAAIVCPHCHRTLLLATLVTPNTCPGCGRSLVAEVSRGIPVTEEEDRGASFESVMGPAFHFSVEELRGSLDLPRWFLQVGAHSRQMRRIPVNFANLYIAVLLGIALAITVSAGVVGLVQWGTGERLRAIATVGAVASVLLLWVRPYLQSTVTVSRDKITLTRFGERQVLFYGRITEIRNERRLSGWGYAAILRHQYGLLPGLLYAWFFQWLDPRAWTGQYPLGLIQLLPQDVGGATSRCFTNHIRLIGDIRTMNIPFNGRTRRDLTQALAVVVYQVRNHNPRAKIDLTALQVAQREPVTAQQWALGWRY